MKLYFIFIYFYYKQAILYIIILFKQVSVSFYFIETIEVLNNFEQRKTIFENVLV